jgi:branched-chain amino acid transport system substrate-binding protein
MRLLQHATAVLAGILQLFATEYLAAADEVRIGVMGEFSGASAPNGEVCRHGVEVARAAFLPDGKIGEHTMRFVYADHRGEAVQGVTEFKRLVNADGVAAVITTRSQVAMPVSPLSKQLQVPLLAVVGTPRFVQENPFGYRMWPNARGVAQKAAAFALHSAFKTVAAVTLDDEYSVSLHDEFVKSFASGGGKLTADVTIQPDDRDFSTNITRLRNTAPQLLFVNLGFAQSGPMIKKIRELGLTQPILANAWVGYREVLHDAGPAALEGTSYVDFDYEKPRFVELLKREFPSAAPIHITYSCYAAARFLTMAVQKLPAPLPKGALQSALVQISTVDLLDEQLRIDQREAVFVPVVKQYLSGTTKIIQP